MCDKNEKYTFVHCKTKEEAIKLLKASKNISSFCWPMELLSLDHYDDYDCETCYSILLGVYTDILHVKTNYGDEGKIVEFSDLDL